MSGVEVVGVVASTLQIAACISNIIILVIDVREELRRGPLKIKEQAEYLTSLVFVLQSLEKNPLLQKPEIQLPLAVLEDKIRLLQDKVHRYLQSPAKGSFRKVCIAIGGVQVEEKIANSVEALDREKSTLLLYISARSSEEVHWLFESYMSDSMKLKKMLQMTKTRDKEGKQPSHTTAEFQLARKDSVLSPVNAPDTKDRSALTVAQRKDLEVLPSKHSRPDPNNALQRDHPPQRLPERQTLDRQPQFLPHEARGHNYAGVLTYGPNSSVRYGDTNEVSIKWAGHELPSAPAQNHNYNFSPTNAPGHFDFGNLNKYMSDGDKARDAGK